MKLDKDRTLKIIKAALKEDVGPRDITTQKTVHKLDSIEASIVANEDCILCGLDIAEWTIGAVDQSVRFKPQAEEGQRIYRGKEVAFLEGRASSILTAERTMLNFVCLLSGIATEVDRFVQKIKGYASEIYDTRKTLPLLRYLEKYAVRVGGGCNHRIGLWDQVLIKENHIKVGQRASRKINVKKIRETVTKNIKIEIEVEGLSEFRARLNERPDIIMLDNMSAEDVREAVLIRDKAGYKPKPLLEVSGGVHIDNVEEYAKTGVERISIGSLTDSVRSIDMSLDVI